MLKKEAGREQLGHLRLNRTICRAAVRAISLKLIVGPLAVVNMAPEERHDSSARSDAIGPLARVRAHEFKGLAVESPAGAAAAADVSISVSNILPGVAIGAGAFKAGHLVAAGWWLGFGRQRRSSSELETM